MPSTCGASIDQHLKLSSRKNLVGVCSTCGSICYKCKEEESLRASEVAVWKATQVAELISCFPDVSKLFSQKNTIDGLSAIIASYGDGQSAILARKVGLNKSVLWEWVHGNNHPSFGLFLDLCLAVGVSVVSVLKGCPVECLSPLPELISPKQHAQKATDEKRGELLKQALTITPPESLKAIATTLGVDRKMLRIKFPELSRLVVERFRLFISSQITDKDNLTRETVQRVINELTVNGMPLTLRNFQAAIGKALLPESRLRKFFSEYLLFLNDKSLLCLTLISEKLF